MASKWVHLKPDAIRMRMSGDSLTSVEKSLGIPKSTLSDWFKKIALTQQQKIQLSKNRIIALKLARVKAVEWHTLQKENRLKEAEKNASKLLANINTKSRSIQELALAMLYLGEGIKNNPELGLGNSDPLILKFFIKVLETNFKIDKKKIRAELYLRADQDSDAIKKFWSKELDIPVKNFRYSVDKRTTRSTTYSSYKGVCLLRCGNVSIQRKLLYTARKYCKQILDG